MMDSHVSLNRLWTKNCLILEIQHILTQKKPHEASRKSGGHLVHQIAATCRSYLGGFPHWALCVSKGTSFIAGLAPTNKASGEDRNAWNQKPSEKCLKFKVF